MPLTDVEVRALRTGDRIYKRADERGLYIEVHPTGSKLWRFKYKHVGKDKRIALGRYPEVGLAHPRRLRDEARLKLKAGTDPLADRRRRKLTAQFSAANTFGDVAKEYIDKMVAEGRADTTTSKANWLLEQLAPLAKFPVADLKAVEVLAALKRIEAKGKYETARRCRSFASRVFRYVAATGRAETDPTSVLRGALITPKLKHHSAMLDPADLGELLRSIDAYSGQLITRLAMQISPHVMARPGELRKAQWCEFDYENAVWKISADRMKMRRPHVVPLSRQVMAYLVELYPLTGPDGFVFPAFHTSKRPLSENTVNQAFRRMGFAVEEITAHGLRTTASTLPMRAADGVRMRLSARWRTPIPTRSGGIYNRGRYWDERVAMHEWWSDYLDSLREQESKSAVAPHTGFGLKALPAPPDPATAADSARPASVGDPTTDLEDLPTPRRIDLT